MKTLLYSRLVKLVAVNFLACVMLLVFMLGFQTPLSADESSAVIPVNVPAEAAKANLLFWGGGEICPLGVTITDTFSGDNTQLGRIFRDGVASTCTPEAYPGIFNEATTYNYETYTYENGSATDSCVVVQFNPDTAGDTPCGTNAHMSAYVDSYNPISQSLNYLGDVGSSTTQPFSFTLPGGQALVLAVTNTGAQAVCSYAFTVTQFVCPVIATTDVAIGKSAPATAVVGEIITYTISAANIMTDSVDATNVVITDVLDPGLVYVSSTASSGSYSTTSGTWVIPTITVGTTETLYIQAQVNMVGTITNTATLASLNEVDSNDENNSAWVTTVVTNHAPTADAGITQTVALNALVMLDGSGSSDPDGHALTYLWTQITGTTAITLSDNTAVTPTFTATTVGVYTFTLTVTDSYGLASPTVSTVVIFVEDPVYPVYLPVIMRPDEN